jgi:hypothetical protein
MAVSPAQPRPLVGPTRTLSLRSGFFFWLLKIKGNYTTFCRSTSSVTRKTAHDKQ